MMMGGPSALRFYLEVNGLLAVGAGLLLLFWRRFSPGVWLRWSRLVFVAAFLLPLVTRLSPHRMWPRPMVAIWSAASRNEAPTSYPVVGLPRWTGVVSPGGLVHVSALSYDALFVALGLVVLCALWGITRLLSDGRRLGRLLDGAVPVRRLGRVRIAMSDRTSVAFACWWAGRAHIVLPSPERLPPELWRLAILHELQHHRSRDTLWLYPLELVRALCYFNPFTHLWARMSVELQEMACDEAITLTKISPEAYARGLLQAAEQALSAPSLPWATTGMMPGGRSEHWKRRLEMLFGRKTRGARKWARIVGLATLTCLTTVSLVCRSAVTDRRISAVQAKVMAKTAAESPSDFPLVVNDAVLHELNRYLGTPQGRENIQNALERLPDYEACFQKKLDKYDLPQELLAVALVESGYKNLPATSHPTGLAAGVWQFVATTARHFGLKVGKGVDERVNVEKETDAAMRYLEALHLRFKDWGLALAGYNQGENAVQSAIDATGVRDPWKLQRMGKINEYLPQVVAAAIILRNPSVVEN